ncbi:hypothetical protein JCM19236_1124 [Vibrio sp. JCM 19236]|nr:hypothetical protein JCM19236_1124 [Vibrio sp. JCM 19236]
MKQPLKRVVPVPDSQFYYQKYLVVLQTLVFVREDIFLSRLPIPIAVRLFVVDPFYLV